MENQEQIAEKYHKPTFDGRINYHLILKQHLEIISRCIITKDYNTWINTINSTYALVCPFIKESDKIGKMIEKVDKNMAVGTLIVNNNMLMQYHTIMNKQLLKLTQDLYKNAKDLFLQSGSDEDYEGFDVERFLRESDI